MALYDPFGVDVPLNSDTTTSTTTCVMDKNNRQKQLFYHFYYYFFNTTAYDNKSKTATLSLVKSALVKQVKSTNPVANLP